MAATIEVVFVGDDPEQRAAFAQPERSWSAPPTNVADVEQPAKPAEMPPLPIVRPDDPPQVEAPKAPPIQAEILDDVINNGDLVTSIGQLIDKIDALIESDRQASQKPTRHSQGHSGGKTAPEKQPESVLSRIDNSFQKMLDTFGARKTRVGKMLSKASNNMARRVPQAVNAVRSTARRVAKTKAFQRIASSKAGQAVAKTGRAVAMRLGMGGAAQAAGAGAAGAGAGGAGAAGAGAAAGAGLAGVATATAVVTGPMIAAGVAAAGLAYTFNQLHRTVASLASSLEDLSPAINAQRATADVRMELLRLDRAQKIGPDLAQLEAARSRLSEAMYSVQTRILEAILKAAPGLVGITDQVALQVRYADVIAATVKGVEAKLTKDKEDDKEAAKELTKALLAYKQAHDEANFNKGVLGNEIDPMLGALLDIDLSAMGGGHAEHPAGGGGHGGGMSHGGGGKGAMPIH